LDEDWGSNDPVTGMFEPETGMFRVDRPAAVA
jgi:hypothetical protein